MKSCLLTLFFFFLILKANAQAPNDDCINATLIQLDNDGTGCLSTDNLAATSDGYFDACDAGATPPLPPGGNEVWFTFQTMGDSNSITVFPNFPQIVDPSISVMTGDCNSLSTLVCHTSTFAEVNFNVPAGTQVWFSVTALTTDGAFNVCVLSVNTHVNGGSDCVNATKLCNLLPFLSTNVNPPSTGLVPSCFSGPPVHPLWYQFTVGTTGLLEFTGQPTGFPNNGAGAHWALYEVTDTANVCNNPSLIMCNANYVPGSLPVPQFGMSAAAGGCTGSSFCPAVMVDSGKTYLLLIDNVDGDPAGFTLWWDGDFQLGPTADFTVSEQNVCVGSPVEVTYTGNAPLNANFSWNPPQSSNNFTTSFTSTGINYISLHVEHNGCADDHKEAVNVFPVPVADAGSDVTFCDSAVIGTTPAPGINYSWIPSVNLSTPGESMTTVRGNNIQPYDSLISYFLIANDGLCSDTDSVVVTIIPKQSAVFLPPADQCVNDNSYAFTLLHDSVPNAIFNWTFQNGLPASSSAAEPSGVNFSAVGQFTVTLIAQSPGCPADTSSDIVTIHPAPVVSFTASDNEGCPPLEVELINTSPPLAGGILTWHLGNGLTDTSSGNTATVAYEQSGTYYPMLTITSPDGCSETDTLDVPVTVLDLPDASFTVTPPLIEDLYPFAEFFNSEFNGICLYSFGDGDSSYDCQTSHGFPGEGIYPVELIVTGTNGCSDTTLKIVEVKKFATLYIPNAFTPNNDGRNDAFRVFGDGMEEIDVRVYNRRGEKVFISKSINDRWNGTHLETGEPVPDGVYVYEIKTVDRNRKKHYYKGQVFVIR